jgi:hypothetical protein
MGRSPTGAHTRRVTGFRPMRCSSVAKTWFGGLQLRTIGRQINEANPIGDFEIGGPMPPRIVEHEQDDAAQARFGFAHEGFKQGLEKFLRHTVR